MKETEEFKKFLHQNEKEISEVFKKIGEIVSGSQVKLDKSEETLVKDCLKQISISNDGALSLSNTFSKLRFSTDTLFENGLLKMGGIKSQKWNLSLVTMTPYGYGHADSKQVFLNTVDDTPKYEQYKSDLRNSISLIWCLDLPSNRTTSKPFFPKRTSEYVDKVINLGEFLSESCNNLNLSVHAYGPVNVNPSILTVWFNKWSFASIAEDPINVLFDIFEQYRVVYPKLNDNVQGIQSKQSPHTSPLNPFIEYKP